MAAVMTTTPLWVPLLVTALGIIGTVAGTVTGVVLTQRQASRRDDLNWSRERERERERWAREDADRTFSHRRDAYVDFYEALRDMAFLIYNFGMGLSEEPGSDEGRLPFDFQLRAFRKLQHLRLYAIPATAQAAEDAYNAAWRWGDRTRFAQDDEQFYEDQNDFDTAEEVLRTAIRTDMGVPSTRDSWIATLADPSGRVFEDP
jgi:hypothetical protein